MLEIHERFLGIAAGLSEALAAALARVGPVTLTPYREAPFPEQLCRSIAGQQLSVKAARTIWGRVVDNASCDSLIAHFAEADPDALRACGLSAAKAKAMRAIAEAAQGGALDEAELAALDGAERAERLTAIWGVGQWTADMMRIFYFGETDVWPDGDVTARKTLERLTSKRRKTTRTAARFAPHRSYLALYMWRYVDAAPN